MSNKNSNILIVDDEPANILLLSKILQSNGYTNVMTTDAPLDTVVLQEEHNYALILLDINMPEITGYEVLKQLRELDNFLGTKVVATSGDVSPKDIKNALEAGFDDYITKPMRMNDILKVVEKALDNQDVR